MSVGANGYYDLRVTQRWAAALLLAMVVVEGLYGILNAFYVYIFQAVVAEDDLDGWLWAYADAADGAAQLLGFVYLAVFAVTVIASGMWIYRAAWNAKRYPGPHEAPSPGWAVGWYFVPIMTFWKPYGEMKKIWAGTVAIAGKEDGERPSFMSWWWALWVTSNLVAQGTTRATRRTEDAEILATVSVIDVINAIISILAALLFRKLILTVTDMQSGLASQEATEPGNIEGELT